MESITEEPAIAVEGESEEKSWDYKLYKGRFAVALILCLSSGLSGYILSTFISIWFIALDFFATDSMGINMFSIVYMIFFFPGSIISIFITERFGVGHALCLGSLANFLSCWVRYAGSLESTPDRAYNIVLFGQIIAAIGQPLLLNAPPRIANDWFPIYERDIAIHVMTQANNIGGALGVLIPAYQISVESDISGVLFILGIVGTIILFLSTIFIRGRPPTPPGREVHNQIVVRSNLDTAGAIKLVFQMFVDFKVMLSNVNFVLLMASFSIEIGVCWAFMAVVGQMIYPCGYDVAVVGIAGSSLSFAGVIGSFVVAQYLRSHKNYVWTQKAILTLTAISAILCLISNAPGNLIFVIAAWNIFGFFQGPLIPITLEHAAEITYPIPADNSAALLFTGVNIVCLVMTLSLTPMLTDNVSLNCSSIISPAAILVFFVVIFGALLSYPIKPEYKRMKVALKLDNTDIAMSDVESPKEGNNDDNDEDDSVGRQAVMDEEVLQVNSIELTDKENIPYKSNELQFFKSVQI